MPHLRLLIADDEPPARALLREYAANVPKLEIVGEAENGAELVALCREFQPDVMVIDIQMPELTGFEALKQIEKPPRVIFSTAYNDHAVRAFEENAVDYLLKPYTLERFRRAVEKVRAQTLTETPFAAQLESFARLLDRAATSQIMVRNGSRILPVQTADIIWIEAAEDYAILHTAHGKFTAGVGVGELEKRLDESAFMRVHRSAIINAHHIRHIETDASGALTVVMANNAKVKVSRSRLAQIRALIV
jgi:two-component system LytT family response regulator